MIEVRIGFDNVDSDHISRYYMDAFLSLNGGQKRVLSRSVVSCEIRDDEFLMKVTSLPATRDLSKMFVSRMLELCGNSYVRKFIVTDGKEELVNSEQKEELVVEDVVAERAEAPSPSDNEGLEEAIKPDEREIEGEDEEPEPSVEFEDLKSVLNNKALDVKKIILSSDYSIEELLFLLDHEEVNRGRVTIKRVLVSKIIDSYDLSSILSMSVWNIKKYFEQDDLPEFVLRELLDEETNNKNRKTLVPFIEKLLGTK